MFALQKQHLETAITLAKSSCRFKCTFYNITYYKTVYVMGVYDWFKILH